MGVQRQPLPLPLCDDIRCLPAVFGSQAVFLPRRCQFPQYLENSTVIPPIHGRDCIIAEDLDAVGCFPVIHLFCRNIRHDCIFLRNPLLIIIAEPVHDAQEIGIGQPKANKDDVPCGQKCIQGPVGIIPAAVLIHIPVIAVCENDAVPIHDIPMGFEYKIPALNGAQIHTLLYIRIRNNL